MPLQRARETGHGLGFALLALGLAVSPVAGWAPFPGGYALLMAILGLVLLAWAVGGHPGRKFGHAKYAPWPRERTMGFFAGAAAFWALFLVTGASVGALHGPLGKPDAADLAGAPLHPAEEQHHAFHLDPNEFLALGAPPSSMGPSWSAPNGTLRIEGNASWNGTSGLARLHVILEGQRADETWSELGRWTLAPDGTFNATLATPPGHVRIHVRPDAANPVFRPVDVDVTVTFLARAGAAAP